MKQRELMILTGEREVGTIAALRGPGARGVLEFALAVHPAGLPRT